MKAKCKQGQKGCLMMQIMFLFSSNTQVFFLHITLLVLLCFDDFIKPWSVWKKWACHGWTLTTFRLSCQLKIWPSWVREDRRLEKNLTMVQKNLHLCCSVTPPKFRVCARGAFTNYVNRVGGGGSLKNVHIGSQGGGGGSANVHVGLNCKYFK